MEETLRRDIVPTVARAVHAKDESSFLEGGLVKCRGMLDAPVTASGNPGLWSSIPG